MREYWRFDPTGKWIAQGLVGWRLADSRYERVREEANTGCFRSEVLGLEMRAEEWLLRFRDPLLGRDLLTHSETSRALQETSRALRDKSRALQEAEHERYQAERKAEAEAASRLQAERERDEAARRIEELEARLGLSR